MLRQHKKQCWRCWLLGNEARQRDNNKSDGGHIPRHLEIPPLKTNLVARSSRHRPCQAGHRPHFPTKPPEDFATISQQKDARQQSQRRRRLRLGMRRGSCHGPRGVGGLLPPPRKIGLPPGLGRSVGRIGRSYDLRVVRGNFQQVPIELFGCRPFREGCLFIRHVVFLRGCGDNVGKYSS